MSTNDFSSPIEERHIDFLLEEEFIANPDFLPFFLGAAEASRTSAEWSAPFAHQEQRCHAVRSATTIDGETDVLVTYRSSDEKRIAILIEDKIGAAFQPTQAERYKLRGERGAGQHWDSFWTCLVSPESYSPMNSDFDARVSLETIRNYFARRSDSRSIYKAEVFARAVAHGTGGLKNIDGVMTAFRASYADAAANHLAATPLVWEAPRNAWYDDSWFKFTSCELPKGVRILHKTKAGLVHLNFPKSSTAILHERYGDSLTENGIKVIESVGSASLEISVPKVCSFTESATLSEAVATGLHAVSRLFEFAKVTMRDTQEQDEIERAKILALEQLLHGLIRARALGYKSKAPWSLPDLVELSKTRKRWLFFNSPSMAGDFDMYLDVIEPAIYVDSGSRVQSDRMFHKLFLFGISSEPYDEYDASTFEDFILLQIQDRESFRRRNHSE